MGLQYVFWTDCPDENKALQKIATQIQQLFTEKFFLFILVVARRLEKKYTYYFT